MMRNPRDVFTSYLHFSRSASFLVNPGTQTEFLHKFLDGKGVYGLLVDCLCRKKMVGATFLPLLDLNDHLLNEIPTN